MNGFRWAIKEAQWFGRRVAHALTGKYYVNRTKYAGCGMISNEVANEFILKGLSQEEPFAVGRTGFSEIGYVCCAQNEIYYNSRVHYHWTPSYINEIELFFDNNGLQRYREIAIDAMNTMDAIGTYPDMFMCDAVLETVPGIKNIKIFNTDVLSTLGDYTNRWTTALKGKRVLVVSPFVNEIKIQYEKRNLIWNDGRIPECELLYDPSLWVVDEGGFFESLKKLTDRVLIRDFDVALLGCGQLGLPLAASIKKSGRGAIQLGSMIHILFGLKGKRWDNLGIYNEHWIRPGEDTKPSYADSLDEATYW